MPLLNTTPATGSGGMLANENRVPSHWRLLTIIFWILGRNSGFNEIDGVLPDSIDTFILDILSVLVGKFEFGSECGFFQRFKNLRCPICHLVSANYFSFESVYLSFPFCPQRKG